nr:hypothetical protein CFP56_71621 [Quercus suber]
MFRMRSAGHDSRSGRGSSKGDDGLGGSAVMVLCQGGRVEAACVVAGGGGFGGGRDGRLMMGCNFCRMLSRPLLISNVMVGIVFCSRAMMAIVMQPIEQGGHNYLTVGKVKVKTDDDHITETSCILRTTVALRIENVSVSALAVGLDIGHHSIVTAVDVVVEEVVAKVVVVMVLL